MRNKRENSKTRNSAGREEGERSARRMQLRHWLLLGATAAGAAGALAKWALAARHDAAHKTRHDSAPLDDFLMSPLPLKPEPIHVMPQSGMPDSATPTNDARTPLVTPEVELFAQAENAHLPVANPSKSPMLHISAPPDLLASSTANTGQTVPQTALPGGGNGRSSGNSKQKNSRGKKMDTSSPKRSKMSQDYDQALEANAMQASSPPMQGHDENLNRAMEGKSEATKEPASTVGGQAESKLSIGEELREREFPIPPQATGAASQKLVVDQETMTDEGLRMGGTEGTAPGDHQNTGKVGDIIDQQAKTPDLAQQR